MKQVVSALMLIALSLVGASVVAFGSAALVFPLVTLILFFSVFLVLAVEAYYESERAPGIDKLQEPDWGSMIHNTWLFKTNIEAWAEYASTVSLLASVLLGTIMGALYLLNISETGLVAYVSWLTSFFVTGTIAFGIATAEHWTIKAEAAARMQKRDGVE